MFEKASDRIAEEKAIRTQMAGLEPLKFGVSFLDSATRGIFPSDLILLGAPTGIGKTELCVNIAMANLEAGKRVHFIALEADRCEIERRIFYSFLAKCFFYDKSRPQLSGHLNMADWMLGKFRGQLDRYEQAVEEILSTGLSQLFTFYKAKQFTHEDLIYNIGTVAHETDLIIVDHVHFFDWDESDDNRAIKQIAKTARDIVLEMGKPMVLVAHLRKRDRGNKDLCPGVDEFHGSSDLTKIATKAITIASGGIDETGSGVTFMRVCKNRLDGSTARYMAKMKFNFQRRAYEEKFKLSWPGEKFDEITDYPFWAREFREPSGGPVGGNHPAVFQRNPYAND